MFDNEEDFAAEMEMDLLRDAEMEVELYNEYLLKSAPVTGSDNIYFELDENSAISFWGEYNMSASNVATKNCIEMTREEERLQEKLQKEKEMWDNYRKLLAKKEVNPEKKN